MATTYTTDIDPDGTGDYTSASNWEAGEQAETYGGDISATTGSDSIVRGRCQCTGGTADTTQCSINGWTTESGNYLELFTDTAESYRHNGRGTWPTGNIYRLDVTLTSSWPLAALYVNEDYARVTGLAIRMATAETYGHIAIDLRGAATASDHKVSYCVIVGDISASSGTKYGVYAYTGVSNIWNCIIRDFIISGTAGRGIQGRNDTINVSHVVIHNCYQGVYDSYGNTTIDNSAVFECNDDFAGSGIVIQDCAADDTDTGVTVNPSDWTAVFESVSGDDFRLKSTDTDLTDEGGTPVVTGFTDDIGGNARSSPYDIGAWENPGSGTTKSVSDTGSGADSVELVSASVPTSDQGAGSDLSAVSVQVTVADAGSGSDNVGIDGSIAVADVGAGADQDGVSASVPVADTGAGADTPGVTVTASISDSGTGADVIDVLTEILKQVSDVGSGADAIASVSASLQLSDVGAGADVVAATVQLTLADTATGADVIDVITETLKQVSDVGAGADAVSSLTVSLTLPDSASGADSVAVAGSISISDSSSAADAINVLQTLAKVVSDAGSGVDSVSSIIVNVPVADTAAAVDTIASISAALTLLETVVGVDTPRLVTLAGQTFVQVEVAFQTTKNIQVDFATTTEREVEF